MFKKRTVLFALMYAVILAAGYLSTGIPFQSDPDPYALIPEVDRQELETFEKAFNQGEPMVVIVLKHTQKWHLYSDFQTLHQATEW